MALFQKTVISKYLQSQNSQNLISKWDLFCAHFHNPEIQTNIRSLKEEEYQEGFLRDLFVNVFGYILRPQINYNLYRELKNVNDSKKADGGIIINNIVSAVIELKGTDTTDLGRVKEQAFGYKVSQKACLYVITSNFEKLRFYIDDSVEHIEFNLFELTQEEFNLMYLVLAFENIKNDIPKKLKEESVSQEDIITKKLYKDYSVFKRELFQNLILLNPEYEPLELFQKLQKLLDRLLFLFFGEDRGLLPPNYIRKIIGDWTKLKELDAYFPLYDRYKQNFEYLNSGTNKEVFAYNGGLFKEDSILDQIKIDDDLLYKHTFRLSEYNFASEIDVNILGHIFENSLNEIEEIKAQLEGLEIDKSKSKRKKDGVFYTPKYITKYIVENTVGKLCEDKKQELEIFEGDYFSDKKRQQKTKEPLLKKLDQYRTWLLQITIVDPACGSGAFLNEALNFLIAEHQYITELESKLLLKFGTAALAFDVETSILENNLFGVDLNEESVEIAKLSLWLRTAQRNRKLNNLNDNIKCGNSLIDDPKIAGDKAFDWQKEFPQVFAKGGFDVVIGNPPYGIFINEVEKKHYNDYFPLTSYKINLYILFVERMLQILDKGVIHFIIPKSLLFNSFYKAIREKLLTSVQINEIRTITEEVFEDADVGSSLLLNFEIKKDIDLDKPFRLAQAEKISDFITNSNLTENYQSQRFFFSIPNFEISIINQDKDVILLKLLNFDPVKDFYKLKNGLNPGNIKHILISNSKDSLKHKQIIWGKDINRYTIDWSGDYINYDENLLDTIGVEDIKSKQGMKSQTKIDFALRNPQLFENEKIVVRKTGDKFIACLDLKNYYFDTLVHGIYKLDDGTSLKCLLAILNSKPATIFYRLLHDIEGKIFAKISLDNLASFPLPLISNDQDVILSVKADLMLSLKKDLHEISCKFQRICQRKFENLKLIKKLQDWYNLSYADFIKELSKQKIKLTLTEEAEWEEYFTAEKNKALTIQNQFRATDQEIDRMVYEVYGLSEEEIAIVES